MDDLIEALRRAADGGGKVPGAKGKEGKCGGSRKRAKITPEVKEKVKVMVKEGNTGEDIAKAVGISLPSVQNIKRNSG